MLVDQLEKAYINLEQRGCLGCGIHFKHLVEAVEGPAGNNWMLTRTTQRWDDKIHADIRVTLLTSDGIPYTMPSAPTQAPPHWRNIIGT